MTRDEFMKEAEHEIDQVLLTHKNRIMNLVMKAWSEGKKNAEIDAMTKMAREMLDKIYPPVPEEDNRKPPSVVEIEVPAPAPAAYGYFDGPDGVIPAACRSCRNHPSNGGSGNCNCILGIPEIKC